MPYLPNYKKPFSAFVKKQHKPFQAVIEDETLKVCARPDIGEAKTGDLTGFYVHKFKHKTQEYLMAYQMRTQKRGTRLNTGPLIFYSSIFTSWARTKISTMISKLI